MDPLQTGNTKYNVNIRAFANDILYDFDYGDHDYTYDLDECLFEVETWHNLMINKPGVCLYSVLWPETPDLDGYEYREITGIKTKKGEIFLPGYSE